MASRVSGEKVRIHNHYLKSTIFCGACGSRLVVQLSKNRHDVVYDYFMCVGRHLKRNDCVQPVVPIHVVEDKIVDRYKSIALSPTFRGMLERQLTDELRIDLETEHQLRPELESRREALTAKRMKLLEAHYAGAIPVELLKSEQDLISRQLADVNERLQRSTLDEQKLRRTMEAALALSENCYEAYRRAPDHIRRLFNQAFFTRVLVDVEANITVELAQPFEALLERAPSPVESALAARAASSSDNSRKNKEPRPALFAGRGSNEVLMVGPAGLEPATNGLKVRCSTN
ncbi:MAG: recombinase family protein [Glaciihabitans sp.]|jgi:site-specific DNA recombinase|nr:recombinase family protein [Glaciihabitans sp.]